MVVAARPQRTTGIAAEPTPVAVSPIAPDPPRREVVAIAESHPDATGSVVVRAGDTLWSIAQRRLGAGAPAAKVADEVHRLTALNDLEDPNLIRAGERLRT